MVARQSSAPLPTHACDLAVCHVVCATCSHPLHRVHRAQRTIRQLDGVWRLTLSLVRCHNHSCSSYHRLCRPEAEGAWALPHSEFGFDVIALVGQLRYTQHRSIPEIHQQLCLYGVVIAERTVTNLLARYEELIAVRFTSMDHLRERFLALGQVILGLDGMKPDVGHEVLWVLRDCLSGDVLLARSLLSECEEEVAKLIQEVQTMLPVPITGVISDGQRSIRRAGVQVS